MQTKNQVPEKNKATRYSTLIRS